MTGTADSILFSQKEHICYTQNYDQFVTFITSITNEFECQLIIMCYKLFLDNTANKINDNQTVCVLVSHHIKILFHVVIVVTTVYYVVSTFLIWFVVCGYTTVFLC